MGKRINLVGGSVPQVEAVKLGAVVMVVGEGWETKAKVLSATEHGAWVRRADDRQVQGYVWEDLRLLPVGVERTGVEVHAGMMADAIVDSDVQPVEVVSATEHGAFVRVLETGRVLPVAWGELLVYPAGVAPAPMAEAA